jgi:cysteine synthase B
MSLPLRRCRRLSSITEGIGQTPLVRLTRVARSAPSVEVFVKLETMNPGGSVKDRAALRIIEDAIADGRLNERVTLIDATSGNTGVAYSLVGAALGYRVALVMPSNVTQARKDITRAFGGHGRLDPTRPRARRRAPGAVLLRGPVLEPIESAGALPRDGSGDPGRAR